MAQSTLVAPKESSLAELEHQASLYDGLRAESMPKHVALFMEGVSRRELIKDIARICCELGIKVLTVHTFLSGNLYPPKLEDVDVARNLMEWGFEELARNDIRVSIIGKRDDISNTLLELIREVEEATKNNKSLHIIKTIDYTGRSDITQACITLAEKVEHGLIQPEDIDEHVFQQELETKCLEFPNPDLMIRAGGKYSLDNFMLWQMAYTELHFVEKDDLEFNKIDFIKALDVYQNRSRRFGGM